MSDTSNDPSKYWRGSVAIPTFRKEILDKRMAELGLKTLGELTTFFILGEGVVEALKPVMAKYEESRRNAVPTAKAKELARQLQDFSPEELERLMALAKQGA